MLKKLAAERLVTLTGPGGVGKTRLAAEAAARLAGPAWFAELAPVSEPSEVPYAVLDALGLRDRVFARHGADVGPAGPVDPLCGALVGRDAVLILDNCEHVVEAAALLSGRLLAGLPRRPDPGDQQGAAPHRRRNPLAGRPPPRSRPARGSPGIAGPPPVPGLPEPAPRAPPGSRPPPQTPPVTPTSQM